MRIIGSLLVFLVAFSAAKAGPPVDVVVNCGNGELIQDALNASDSASPLRIEIRGGACNEDIEIFRDNVSIRGRSTTQPSGIIRGEVYVYGVRGIRLSNMRIMNSVSGIGVLVTRGASVFLRSVHMTGHKTAAVKAELNSLVQVWHSIMHGAGSGSLVAAADGSTVNLLNSELRSNSNVPGKGAALDLRGSSSARLDSLTRIRNNFQPSSDPKRALAIRLDGGSSLDGTTGGVAVTGNVHLRNNSTAELFGIAMTGQLLLERRSTVNVNSGTSITGAARVSSRSLLGIEGGGAIDGNVTCTGGSAITGGDAGNVSAGSCPIAN